MKEDTFIKKMNKWMDDNYGWLKSPASGASYTLGVSKQFVGQMMLGNKPPNQALLDEMGYYKKVTITYHKEEK